MKSAKQEKAVVRDDNLRLLYAEAERAAIEERKLDLRGGVMLLVIFIAATLMFGYAAGNMQMAADTEINLFAILLFLVWLVAIAATLFSPLILLVLIVEYRRVRRDQHELLDLLKRYNRI